MTPYARSEGKVGEVTPCLLASMRACKPSLSCSWSGFLSPGGKVSLRRYYFPYHHVCKNARGASEVKTSCLEPKSSYLTLFNQLHQGYCLEIIVQSIPDSEREVEMQLTCLASTFQVYGIRKLHFLAQCISHNICSSKLVLQCHIKFSQVVLPPCLL